MKADALMGSNTELVMKDNLDSNIFNLESKKIKIIKIIMKVILVN